VGSYFDIGNACRFAASEKWIRILGRRIVKLDVKDWSKAKGLCDIGDGDVNWPAVREALAEIHFSGWATAEVRGGGRERLAEISRRMDQVLDIR
jgi:hexulose-6-phosphate isomerase